MSALSDPDVWLNGDGTYTIKGDHELDGDWTLRDTGHGWAAEHPEDGFDNLWASAEDAAGAVLGDPAKYRRHGETRLGHAVRGWLS